MSESKFNIQRLYVKDIAFDIPDSPKTFQEQGKIETKFEMAVNHTTLEEPNHHEVGLAFTLTGKTEEKELFTLKLTQAGVFQLEGFAEKQQDQLLNAYCPEVLYPYARNAIAQIMTLSTFPPLTLQPINFNAVYDKQKQQRAEQSKAKEAKEPVH